MHIIFTDDGGGEVEGHNRNYKFFLGFQQMRELKLGGSLF